MSALQWRYATKHFDTTKKLTPVQIQTLGEALRLTASSNDTQPRKFIIVSDPDLKQKLFAESKGQAQITTCSHLVVLCGRTDLDDAFVDKFIDYNISQGAEPERSEKFRVSLKERFQTMTANGWLHKYVDQQVYIALGNLLTTCAVLGIDACPMGGFHSAGYDQILELDKQHLRSVVICPVGYRDTSDPQAARPKIRFPYQDVVTII